MEGHLNITLTVPLIMDLLWDDLIIILGYIYSILEVLTGGTEPLPTWQCYPAKFVLHTRNIQ